MARIPNRNYLTLICTSEETEYNCNLCITMKDVYLVDCNNCILVMAIGSWSMMEQ